MGEVWINGSTPGYVSVADVLHDALGSKFDTYGDWTWNSRSSGGFEQLMGILIHHTASNTSKANDLHYITYGNPDNPVSHGLLARDGSFSLIAGGASNHAGKGGGSDSRPPWQTSRGTIPKDSANSRVFGIECANSGVGEAYPVDQQDSYVIMCAALCKAYALDPLRDIRSHWEWTDRKCDPTGPARFCDGNHNGCNGACRWNMDLFRAEVASLTATPTPPPSGEDMLYRIAIKDQKANAKFVGFMDPNGLGHTVSWVRTEAEYKQYETLKAPLRELNLEDLAGLVLLGPLPSGDTLHQWTGQEFDLHIS